jgi:hypothetical protein
MDARTQVALRALLSVLAQGGRPVCSINNKNNNSNHNNNNIGYQTIFSLANTSPSTAMQEAIELQYVSLYHMHPHTYKYTA